MIDLIKNLNQNLACLLVGLKIGSKTLRSGSEDLESRFRELQSCFCNGKLKTLLALLLNVLTIFQPRSSWDLRIVLLK